MKLSSHTLQNATNTSLRGIPFVILALCSALPVILTLCGAKGKNLRTTRQSLKQPHSIRNNTHGVTLIEMLVALVITALIVSSVYVAFNAGTKSWQVGDTMMQRYQNARGALDMMSREITCALINDWDNIYRMDFYGSNGSTGWRDTIDITSVGDELYFIARLEPSSADADICEVGYYLTDENGDGVGDVLRRFYVTDDAIPANFNYDFRTPSGNTAGKELALNVTALNFRYLNSSGIWETDDIWDSRKGGGPLNDAMLDGDEKGTLPKAVEIIITVQDDKQVAKARTFRTVVYIPGSEQ